MMCFVYSLILMKLTIVSHKWRQMWKLLEEYCQPKHSLFRLVFYRGLREPLYGSNVKDMSKLKIKPVWVEKIYLLQQEYKD